MYVAMEMEDRPEQDFSSFKGDFFFFRGFGCWCWCGLAGGGTIQPKISLARCSYRYRIVTVVACNYYVVRGSLLEYVCFGLAGLAGLAGPLRLYCV